ncbi:hypothetical protein WMF37_20480 [Sorangium sp. So ce291]|uniref:hypothetical protein n=1 Tax=Sorangium sp. So ce291 TaxID=3133294 RepID=UPI003F6327A2
MASALALVGCGADDAGGEPSPSPAASTLCSGAICADDEFCYYPPGACGGKDGACLLRPTTCQDDTQVCACDGGAYASACEAQRAGQSVAAGEACAADAAPPGTFPCGSYFCRSADQYCEILDEPHEEPFKPPPQLFCHPIPASCMPDPSCDCVSEAAGSMSVGNCFSEPVCTQDAGSITVQCNAEMYAPTD